MEINKKQIAAIHILKSQLRLSDEDYGAALEGYGVGSSKELTAEQADDLIKRMRELQTKEAKTWKSTKYDELGIRFNKELQEHYATPKQLRMIEAMWMTSPKVVSRTEEAFLKFIKRVTGKDRIEWLMITDIRKVKKAIESL